MYFLRTSSQHLRKFSNQNTAEEGKREYGKWKLDEDNNYYDTDCNNGFYLTSGTVKDNGLNFCPYCGRGIKVTKERDKNE